MIWRRGLFILSTHYSALYLYSPLRVLRRYILTALMRPLPFFTLNSIITRDYTSLLLRLHFIVTRDYTSLLREITLHCYERLSIWIIQPAVYFYRRSDLTERFIHSLDTLLRPLSLLSASRASPVHSYGAFARLAKRERVEAPSNALCCSEWATVYFYRRSDLTERFIHSLDTLLRPLSLLSASRASRASRASPVHSYGAYATFPFYTLDSIITRYYTSLLREITNHHYSDYKSLLREITLHCCEWLHFIITQITNHCYERLHFIVVSD